MYNNIRTIEAAAYPEYMQYLQEVHTMEDMQEYCESKKVLVLEGEGWYCICGKTEVVDLAAISKLTIQDMLHIGTELKKWFGTKKVTLDARKSTSYRLIKFFSRGGKVSILSEEEWTWGEDIMVEMTIKFN